MPQSDLLFAGLPASPLDKALERVQVEAVRALVTCCHAYTAVNLAASTVATRLQV